MVYFQAGIRRHTQLLFRVQHKYPALYEDTLSYLQRTSFLEEPEFLELVHLDTEHQYSVSTLQFYPYIPILFQTRPCCKTALHLSYCRISKELVLLFLIVYKCFFQRSNLHLTHQTDIPPLYF